MTSYYRQDNTWKFSPIDYIEDSNFNKILERFYSLGIQGLTKENIQNSLDGRLIDSSKPKPVIVKIKIGSIRKNDIPGIENVINHIQVLEGKNTYTKETVSHMKNMLTHEEVRYISFEDINTRGLTGAKNGQSNSRQDTWGIYAYNKGVHFEESDASLEASRGGSHGVGKIASNAASDLHLMYFANCDSENNQHLGGTVQLIEHMYNDQCFRSTGYFTDQKIENGVPKFYPYENDKDVHPVFEKRTRGLKIIIPYLRNEYDNEDEIVKTVCDSFFVSILMGKLEVHINDHILSKDTIEDYVKNPQFYEQDIKETKKVFTPLYMQTYLNEPAKDLVISNGEKDFKFKLFFKYDEDISKGRVGIVRSIGMKIEDFAVRSYATKPYNAVIIGELDEDGYLKSLENESHTKISADHIRDSKLKKHAKSFINNLMKEIAKIVDQETQRRNPTDGIMDTGDLIYLMQTQFKQDLANKVETVKINKGNNLLKTTEAIPQQQQKGTNKGSVKQKDTGIKRKRVKKIKGTGNEVEDNSRDSYAINPNLVERLILQNEEFIRFNFNGVSEMKNITLCNLSFSIIDGMGVEYKNEFILEHNYMTVIDQNTGTTCKIEDNSIKNVSIKDGFVNLKLNLKPTYNKSLKFVYYVEV